MLYFRFINSHNRKHVSFQVAVNHLADHSPKELAILRGRTHSNEYNGGLQFYPDLENVKDIPDTLDWRLYGNIPLKIDLSPCHAFFNSPTTDRVCTEKTKDGNSFVNSAIGFSCLGFTGIHNLPASGDVVSNISWHEAIVANNSGLSCLPKTLV